MGNEISRRTNNSKSDFDRRDFMKLVGGGIVVFFSVDSPASAQQGLYRIWRPWAAPVDLNISENRRDGKITVFTAYRAGAGEHDRPRPDGRR
jgi:hypothetical protein